MLRLRLEVGERMGCVQESDLRTGSSDFNLLGTKRCAGGLARTKRIVFSLRPWRCVFVSFKKLSLSFASKTFSTCVGVICRTRVA